ncbi:chromosome partitioning protein, ParB family [Selenomonas sp. WCT3]|uniref:ParB/RepB/Spo0J family partition protein n=1 Tax=Selenomonas sp. WCT3 TaxID=3158785 RepID=UPI00088617A8|nr:chromosome partitioning protein, ParB family [Selenomonas ruminantium]
MANKAHGGLGKGLGALLKDTKLTPAKDKVQELNVADIKANRYQPRQEFDESALDTLKESVKRIGILEPLLVRKLPGTGYELIAGERRLRAAKLAGLKTVPAMIREYNDAEVSEIALIENIQREDLNAIEEAKAYNRLMKEFGMTQDDMAKKIGRSRSHIANFLRLLKLEPQVQDYVANGALSMGQAKPLLSIENQKLQREAAEYIQAEDLSARQCEALVKKLQDNPDYFKDKPEAVQKDKKQQDVFLTDAVDKLTHLFGTQVKIHPGKKKSKIEIEFYSPEDLERIMGLILEREEQVKKKKIDALRQISLSQKFTV